MLDKNALRLKMRGVRKALPLEVRLDAALNLSQHFPPLNLKGLWISGYHPIGAELDPRPLMAFVKQAGGRLSLPVISDGALIFRSLTPETIMIKEDFGTFAPNEASESVIPDILLMPLLCFDDKGNRLGYGQGHYDRYLASRMNSMPIKIGLAFYAQYISQLPTEPHDIALDYVVTEEKLFRFGA
jgi:5-formyltetrahydrofolate cyclo-ligase